MNRNALLLVALVVIFGGMGCATSSNWDLLREGYEPNSIDEIVVAPVLDLRANKSHRLNLDAWIQPMTESVMEKKGYAVTTNAEREDIAPLKMVPSQKALELTIGSFSLSSNPHWIMVLGLVDSYSKITFGSTGNAEMIGYLVDSRNQKIVWQKQSVGQVGQGGLIGMTMKGMMEKSAIQTATYNLLSLFPKKNAPKKKKT